MLVISDYMSSEKRFQLQGFGGGFDYLSHLIRDFLQGAIHFIENKLDI